MQQLLYGIHARTLFLRSELFSWCYVTMEKLQSALLVSSPGSWSLLLAGLVSFTLELSARQYGFQQNHFHCSGLLSSPFLGFSSLFPHTGSALPCVVGFFGDQWLLQDTSVMSETA